MKNWNKINDSAKKMSNLYEIEAIKCKCENAHPIDDIFDFGLFFNSSELRTLEYSKILNQNSLINSLLIDFQHDDCQLKAQNLLTNRENLKSFTKNNYEELTISDIFKYEDNLDQMIKKLPESIFKVRSKCLIEITGVPLIYSVALLRLLKLAFPSPELFLLNISAKYKNDSLGETPQFSDGFRQNIYIPGYYGNPNFSKPWLYVFLLGFEGNRSLNIYKVNEPTFVEAIIAEPGYQNEYNTKAIEINKSFLSEARIEKEDIIKIDAGDPIKVCEKILSIYGTYKDIANICLVPLGTKPHAIGAGLAALIQKDIAIMYQVPKSYSMNGTKAGENMWIYRIK